MTLNDIALHPSPPAIIHPRLANYAKGAIHLTFGPSILNGQEIQLADEQIQLTPDATKWKTVFVWIVTHVPTGNYDILIDDVVNSITDMPFEFEGSDYRPAGYVLEAIVPPQQDGWEDMVRINLFTSLPSPNRE